MPGSDGYAQQAFQTTTSEPLSMRKSKSTINKEQNISLSPDVIFQRFDEKAILVNLKSEEIYELNETGTQVVESISRGVTYGALLEALKSQYTGGSSEIESDLIQLLEELSKKELVQITPPTAEGHSHA